MYETSIAEWEVSYDTSLNIVFISTKQISRTNVTSSVNPFRFDRILERWNKPFTWEPVVGFVIQHLVFSCEQKRYKPFGH